MAPVASSTDTAATDAAEGLFAYCRAGFEPELAAELGERAALAGLHGHARTERGSGLVEFLGVDGAAASAALPFSDLIFARQKLRLLAHLRGIDPKDRISPCCTAMPRLRSSPSQSAGSGPSSKPASVCTSSPVAPISTSSMPAQSTAPKHIAHGCEDVASVMREPPALSR